MPRGVYPRTDEMKAKMLGRPCSAETRAKIGAKNRARMRGNRNALGYKWTDEQRAKISAAMTPEVRALLSALSTVHGEARRGAWTLTYLTWASICNRCHNPNTRSYEHYGGRGITCYPSVVDLVDDIGERPSRDYCIHRIDNDGNYEPGNCEWMLISEHTRLHNQQRREARGDH